MIDTKKQIELGSTKVNFSKTVLNDIFNKFTLIIIFQYLLTLAIILLDLQVCDIPRFK